MSNDLQRLASLSDGIFAVAMTMLAFNVYVPGPMDEAKLSTALAATSHDLFYLALSFIIAGMFWIRHQRLLEIMGRSARPFLLANLLFLLSVVLLPIATRLISIRGVGASSGLSPLLAAIYGGTLALIGFLHFLLWLYALAGRGPDGRRANIRRNAQRLAEAIYLPVIFLLSVPIGLRKPQLAPLFWVAAFAAPVVGIPFRHWSPGPAQN